MNTGKQQSNVFDKFIRLMMSLVLVAGLCPAINFGMADEAHAAPGLTAGNVGDSTIVASGNYLGYASNADGSAWGTGDGSAYYGWVTQKYSWTLYESGLLSIDLMGTGVGSVNGAQNPGWMKYANQITSVEMTASYSNYYSYSKSDYYYSTISRFMFSGLPNLTTVNAPYVKIVTSNTLTSAADFEEIDT